MGQGVLCLCLYVHFFTEECDLLYVWDDKESILFLNKGGSVEEVELSTHLDEK